MIILTYVLHGTSCVAKQYKKIDDFLHVLSSNIKNRIYNKWIIPENHHCSINEGNVILSYSAKDMNFFSLFTINSNASSTLLVTLLAFDLGRLFILQGLVSFLHIHGPFYRGLPLEYNLQYFDIYAQSQLTVLDF